MKNYKLNLCPRCGMKAELYGSGFAKTVFEDGKWNTFFVDFDGYRVECEKCDTTTKTYYYDAEKAVEEWNNIT